MTLVEAAKDFWVKFGMLFRVIGKELQPDYWICTNCGHIGYVEKEIVCWECGVGEMIYKGELYD
jgi:hypothetical protein